MKHNEHGDRLISEVDAELITAVMIQLEDQDQAYSNAESGSGLEIQRECQPETVVQNANPRTLESCEQAQSGTLDCSCEVVQEPHMKTHPDDSVTDHDTTHSSLQVYDAPFVMYSSHLSLANGDSDLTHRQHASTRTELTTDARDPEPSETRATSPDGGYGWVIVICALFIFMSYGSSWVMFSVYNTEFAEVFDMPQAYVGIIGSVDAGITQLCGLPSSAFVSLYGSRPVCIVGLLIYALGTFLSAFTTNFYVLLLTFSVIKGFGVGMVYVPASMIVQQYFTRRRALAAGIASSGLSLGTLVFGPIHRLLISSYGWRGGLIMASGLNVQVIVCAALMCPISHSPVSKTDTGCEQSCGQRCTDMLRQITLHLRRTLSVQAFKDPDFALFLSIKTMAMPAILAMYKFSVARAVFYGVNKLQAAFLVTAIGIASSVFRNLSGLAANITGANWLLMYSLAVSLGGIVVVLTVCATTGFLGHLISHLVFGAFLGSGECLISTVAMKLFGLDRLPQTLGWLQAWLGIISLVSMPLLGLVFDVTGSFNLSYITCGCLEVLAGTSGFVILLRQRARRRKSDVKQQKTQLPLLNTR